MFSTSGWVSITIWRKVSTKNAGVADFQSRTFELTLAVVHNFDNSLFTMVLWIRLSQKFREWSKNANVLPELKSSTFLDNGERQRVWAFWTGRLLPSSGGCGRDPQRATRSPGSINEIWFYQQTENNHEPSFNPSCRHSIKIMAFFFSKSKLKPRRNPLSQSIQCHVILVQKSIQHFSEILFRFSRPVV